MSGVDVLAVLDRQIEREYNPFEPDNQTAEYPRLIETRAAVAELIEAAQAISGIVRISGLHCLRLDASLRRVQGGQP